MNTFEYENYHERKSHVKENFPYNTYLCSIPLDFTQINTHWNEEVELVIIKKGTGMVMVDLQSYTVHARDIVLILPGQLHAIYQLDDNVMEYENILFKPQLLYGNDICTSDYLRPLFNDKFIHPIHFTSGMKDYEQLYGCIEQIDNLCSMPAFGYELGIKSYLFKFFLLIFYDYVDSASKKPRNKQAVKLKEILYYISSHYTEELTPGDVAEAVGFSTSHFMKFFKQNSGCTFTEYLNDYRLSVVESMLIAGDKSILEISEEAGFTNLSYFNRLFKKKYGVSPREYRKRN